jgi:hypothetical protein
MKKRVFSVFGLVLVAFTLLGVTQRQTIKDYYIVQTQPLGNQSSALAQNLSLTPNASFLYKASQPQVQPAEAFNQSCKSVAHEHSIVLGCYSRQRIYIYNVADTRLNGVKEVTAAHELLHAAYERMSQKEKTELNKTLTATADSIDDQRFKDTLAEYRRTEPGQLENELHSILGTEIAVLPTKLEEHYRKYFTNRSQIVSYAKQYEDSFTSLDSKIKQYDQQLADLKAQKELQENSLNQLQTDIESERARLDQLKNSNETEEYNAAVPGYNAKIQTYNSDITTLKQIIQSYNQIVEARNSLASTQNDLVKQLDSSYKSL